MRVSPSRRRASIPVGEVATFAPRASANARTASRRPAPTVILVLLPSRVMGGSFRSGLIPLVPAGGVIDVDGRRALEQREELGLEAGIAERLEHPLLAGPHVDVEERARI